MKRVRVLIVDDSAVVRKLLSGFFDCDARFEVVGTATDPYAAREKLIQLRPDVMTLDIEMPRMDGITFLQKVMTHLPTRTVIVSSLALSGSETYFNAFAAGAIDVIEKPSLDVTRSLTEQSKEILDRVFDASMARLRTSPPKSDDVSSAASRRIGVTDLTHKIIAIAASTGGTEALKKVLRNLPPDVPGIVIVQHMPPIFTKAFAGQLAKVCNFEVREAVQDERVTAGKALIAPGNYHMKIVRRGAFWFVDLNQDPTVHGVRPAADILMSSVAECAGKNAVGVVLTGMGRDGAKGLLDMKAKGSFNIAQDEETSVVYGMPGAAVQLGAIDLVKPLDEIASVICAKLDLAA